MSSTVTAPACAVPLSPRRALVLLGPLLACLLASVVAHDGIRVVQVAVLAMPGWLWLCWPHRGLARMLQAGLCALLALAFALDASVRGFLAQSWKASPASSMVLTAVANTNGREAAEFIGMYWRTVSFWSVFLLLQAAAIGWALVRWWRAPPVTQPLRGWRLVSAGLLVLLMLVSLASKPWRHHHPLAFWPQWVSEVTALKRDWSDMDEQRRLLLARAADSAPALNAAAPNTLVVVIGESVNRAHLGPYGYPRDTTPQLAAQARSLGSGLEVFRHAWSVDASTVPALQNLFYFGQSRDANRQHLLALARAAGYRTWWISNQDDLAIEQEHARLADEVHLLNQTPGRSGHSLDESVLPLAQAALAHPAPRKLVVLHLLGLHPHYRLRRPDGPPSRVAAGDSVDARLRAEGRPAWLRALRNDYDDALRYHDGVVAATLDLCRRAGNGTAWVDLSDHGQEVGHSIDHAGHSAATPEGYRIPLMVWRPALEDAAQPVLELPVRGDWLGYSLASLLGIEWIGARPTQDVFDRRYQWRAPALPVRFDFRT